MNNIWIITKREYFSRVKSKTFLLTTFLTPLGIVLFMAAIAFIFSRGSDDIKNISVYDPSNLTEQSLRTRSNLKLTYSDVSLDEMFEQYEQEEIAGILEIVPMESPQAREYKAIYHSDDQLAIDESLSIESALSKQIRKYKLISLDIDEETLKTLETDVSISPKTIKSDKKITSITSIVSGALGAVVSYAMFFIILLYGAQVMRSVMEEKINRIVEVLISSVKPFELMFGKVLGVGLVGLTQILIWLVLLFGITMIAAPLLGIDPNTISNPQSMGLPSEAMQEMPMEKMNAVIAELMSMNWWKILPLIILYFFGGYFTYAALFAAVGSAVGEDINEANSLTLPVMMPLMFAFYVGFAAMRAPDSTMAVWASMLPLFSSIVMPVRLPFDPPIWQIAVSIISMILFMVLLIWVAAKIYRVGILMYGKKASFRELGKWLLYKS